MKKTTLLLASTFIGLMAVPAFASTIVLGINGDAQVGATFINFGNYPSGTVYSPAPGYGAFEVSLVNPGIFQTGGVVTGETGMIQSLNETTTPPGTMLNPNPTTALPFMKFDTTGSNLQVFLTELLPGSTVGPFTLTDTGAGAVADFDIDGFVYNTSTHSEQNITGVFSATFAGTTVAQLEATEASGTPINTPFSGTFAITAVPEPVSLLLLGSGLLGVGLISRRKLNQN